MNNQAASMSSIKLGLAVIWPAFWTGVPIKLAIALLFLAFGVHPWEGPGLTFLLVLSIPVDIWALTLCAKTVFLDRLRLEPPEQLGLHLWWPIALFSVVYVPAAIWLHRTAVGGAKAAGHWILGVLPELPVAERIAVELTIWGSVYLILGLVLFLVWVTFCGRMVKRVASSAAPASEPVPALVRRWDLMRIPADQPLLLAALTGAGVVLIFLYWGAMPVTTPHPHEDYPMPKSAEEEPIEPTEVLEQTETVILRAEAALEELEQEGKKPSGKGAVKGGKAAGGKSEGTKTPSKAAGTKAVQPVKGSATAAPGTPPAADDHSH